MDPEEIARREQERAEKKKRKQERKLLKSQGKLPPGDSFHTPGGSESDSGVSQFTDSEQQTSTHNGTIHIDLPAAKRAAGHQTESSCDQTRHDFVRLPTHRDQRTPGEAEQASPESTRGSSPGGPRSSTLQKRNPFSVESLLSDATPRRKSPLDFSSSRTLVGKGHFLLYPITHQPLGFLVPQTALKASPCQDGGLSRLGQRCEAAEGSPAPSDLSGFVPKPPSSEQADGGEGEAEDCGEGEGRLPEAGAGDGGGETGPGVCAEAAGRRGGARAAAAASERASPADCQEAPATDGEDVDMD